MYINPPYQLPQLAESLHSPCSVDWEQFGKSLGIAIATAIDTLVNVIVSAVQNFAASMEDALRDNAYHPQGPVINSTAFTLPDEYKTHTSQLLPFHHVVDARNIISTPIIIQHVPLPFDPDDFIEAKKHNGRK